MKRKLIAAILFITLVIVGCIIGYYIHEQVVSKQQSEIENNSRNEYISQAREQDSLRIAHHQDSVEKAEQLAVAQREREELLRIQAEREAIERKQQEEANRQNEILAQKKRIQEKEYRDNLVEEIDTVYTQVSKPTGGRMLAAMYMRMARTRNKPVVENLVSRVKSDTLWMNEDTRNKYRFIRKKYQQYLNQEYAEVRMWQEPIEKNIIKLYDKLPQTPSSFVYSTQEEILRVKVGCDDVIKDVNGDTSWMKEEFKVKYNHIVKCINAWNKSLEKASDTIKKDIDIKEQEVIEKIHQESIPKFGLG